MQPVVANQRATLAQSKVEFSFQSKVQLCLSSARLLTVPLLVKTAIPLTEGKEILPYSAAQIRPTLWKKISHKVDRLFVKLTNWLNTGRNDAYSYHGSSQASPSSLRNPFRGLLQRPPQGGGWSLHVCPSCKVKPAMEEEKKKKVSTSVFKV